jgi:hypothetical protein
MIRTPTTNRSQTDETLSNTRSLSSGDIAPARLQQAVDLQRTNLQLEYSAGSGRSSAKVCLELFSEENKNEPIACIAHPPRRMSDAGSSNRILRYSRRILLRASRGSSCPGDASLPVRPVVDSHISKCLDGFVLCHTELVVIVCVRPISVLCLLPGLARTVLHKRRLIALGTMMVEAF